MMKKTVLLLVLFLGTLALGMAQSKENDFLDQPYIEVTGTAMMEVVLMLAGAEAGTPNWLVVILGNLFVCGMEGLIVGIQVLRLEYYELFSRFYRGTGREFKPYGKQN